MTALAENSYGKLAKATSPASGRGCFFLWLCFWLTSRDLSVWVDIALPSHLGLSIGVIACVRVRKASNVNSVSVPPAPEM
ncbi:hypothetical protein M427DRAFT_62389 [Gonapodya prolifera JEL478]|uniref:Uncharacterized protein n=1 Tax=Gonapodya prolifera (strain JEL478) TaxID=1344416 RepID=A0A139A0Y8_GONPJ|nr:hypothetical protein M427DRAFT_62389 [Gonapodya prolifera JEL478]|eukprot:KXS10412.1 hypothetical protein M427DRAFT_62389 [Gonapodya prolifera JEL478]